MYEPTILHFAEIAREKSANLHKSTSGVFAGAMFGGAYIGIAMILALSVAAGLPAGSRPLAMGVVFGIGLILTVFAGAELFTGFVMYMGFGLARDTISLAKALQLLVLVWLGNLAGSLILAGMFAMGGGGTIFAGAADLLHGYVAHKVQADAIALLARAALCNWLVCLAIWTATRVNSDTAKCIVLSWVLMAFVAAGFEHSVANMTALSLGLMVDHPTIDLGGAVRNLTLVTTGNILGSLLFVVGGYLLAAKTDDGDTARHDAGLLPTTLRSPRVADSE